MATQWERMTREQKDAQSARLTLYRLALKLEFIAAYGGKCACPGCTESDPVFMCVDHINGGGNKEYHGTGGTAQSGRVTRQILAKIKNLGWPKGEHQPLCWNCNHAKHVLGSLEQCPHNRRSE